MINGRLLALTATILLATTVANAGDSPTKKPAPSRAPAPAPAIKLSPESATVDTILDQAVKNIAARYNLNEAQTAKTAEIMRREVNQFLRTHEEKVWPVIRDLIQAQLGNKPPDDKAMMERVGKAAGSLMGLVEEAILRGNEEWRMYLNPEQKRMHDYDLGEMDRTFKELETNFQAWGQGKPNAGPLFPPPPPPNQSPPRPRLPSQGLPEPEIEIFRPTLFETFVEEFIKKYQLDKAQIEAARSILAEFRSKANDFKNSKKDELKKIALAMRTAHEQADRKKLRTAEAKRKTLLEPIHELFGEMNQRLTALLTTVQVQRFASADTANPTQTPTDASAKSNRTSDGSDKSEASTTKSANSDASAPKGTTPAQENDG